MLLKLMVFIPEKYHFYNKLKNHFDDKRPFTNP